MLVDADGRLINNPTIQQDQPLDNRGTERYKKVVRLTAPEDFILDLVEKDLEEMY